MKSAPQLRPYQQALADEVRLAYRSGFKCPLVVASTGAGKTVLFSYITHGASQRGNPVLIAAHRKEIIRQISLSLARFGAPD
jgi:superfamily II DNA or RNA helicase